MYFIVYNNSLIGTCSYSYCRTNMLVTKLTIKNLVYYEIPDTLDAFFYVADKLQLC